MTLLTLIENSLREGKFTCFVGFRNTGNSIRRQRFIYKPKEFELTVTYK